MTGIHDDTGLSRRGRWTRALSLALALAGPTAATLVTTASAPSQCTVRGATFTPYGSGCTSVFANVPVLSGTFDPQKCAIRLDLPAFGGCCNTFLVERLFVFGATKLNLPVPVFAPRCVLLASPDFVVALPNSAGSTLTVPLPPGIGAGTVYAQAAVHYFTTIGLSHDLELSAGLAIAVR